MRRTIEIIASVAGVEAILGERTDGTQSPGMSWAGPLAALKAHGVAGRMLDRDGAIFDAELTERWGRLVACTHEFSAWWRARPAGGQPPPDFSFFIGDATL